MSPKLSDNEKEKRRLHILKAAEEVFQRKGYESTTMQDIVDETGNSRGWVYLYFSNKDEIFEAMLHEIDTETLQQFASFLEQEGRVWESICTLFDTIQHQLTETEDKLSIVIYEYFIGGWRDPSRRRYLKERYNRQNKIFLKLLEKGIEEGEFQRNAPIYVLEKILMTYWEGLILNTNAIGIDKLEIESQISLMKEMVRNVLFSEK